MFCAGGIAAKAGPAAAPTWVHAQKTTPKAMAIAAATTMSTVRPFMSRGMSRTSLRGFEDQKRSLVHSDAGRGLRGLGARAPPAEAPEQADLFRPRRDRVRDGELEIGLVLRRRELRDSDALPRETFHARVAERIHIAHDEVGKDLPALEGERTAVRRDHEVLVLDRSAIRRKNVAVRDDHRPHRRQNKSGA